MSFSLKPINLCILLITFSWLLNFLTSVEIHFSKKSLLLISTPSNFTQVSELIASWFVFREEESFILLFLLTIIAWNVSGLTIISFGRKQSKNFFFQAANEFFNYSFSRADCVIIRKAEQFRLCYSKENIIYKYIEQNRS